MPAAAAIIPAAIGGVTSLVGGIMGSHAANTAAGQQVAASQKAQQQLLQVLAQYNPQIGAAASTAGTNLVNAAGTAAGNLTGAATGANALLAPFLQAGTQGVQSLAQFMAPGGMGMQNFTAQDMQTLDPGYQFRIDQANKALQTSAAARGGALGGGTLRALDTLSQQNASAEMQNAFARFTTQQQNRFQNLSQLAGMGMAAGGQTGANLMNAAQVGGGWNIGAQQQAGGWNVGAANQMAQNALATNQAIANLITGAGAARAAGTMGAANAWSGAIGGIGNAAIGGFNAYEQNQMLNPALNTSPYSGMARYGIQPWNPNAGPF